MRLAPELKSKIDALWDKFWSGGLSNPLSSIEQMSYLIFMKRLEDMDAAEQKRAQVSNPINQSLKVMRIADGQAGSTIQPKRCLSM